MTIFDTIIAEFTGGLIADVQTAVIGVLAVSFLAFGCRLLIERFLGNSIQTELEYRAYRRDRMKEEFFEKRYSDDSNKTNGPFTRF